MRGKIIISTAYLPPVDYFSLITRADEVLIEKEENYLKQSYRSRCYILTAHGPQMLSVPVREGSRHKVPVKEARIDYSKRWQQVHLRAIISSYRSSPYFDYYFDTIEKIISENHEFLLDLNTSLLKSLMKMMKIKNNISFTDLFEPISFDPGDFRNRIVPGKESLFPHGNYLQVFTTASGFVPNLSIVDLIFNMGPNAGKYL